MASEPETLGWLLLALAGVAVGLLLLFLLYGGIHRAFQSVGFTRGQATLILLGSLIGGTLNIPLWVVGDWVLGVNVGGAIIPIVVTVLLLRRYPELWREALPGIVFVTGAAYLVTEVTPEGIVSRFPFYFVPVVVASVFSMIAHWREESHAAPLAYIVGTLGVLIGADVLRIGEFLAQPAPPGSTGPAMASIGGASVFDMVFLTGILAVLLDLAFFSRRRSELSAAPAAYFEGEVFTPGTPYRVINGPVKPLPTLKVRPLQQAQQRPPYAQHRR